MASDKDDLIGSLMNMLGDHPEDKIASLLGSLSDNQAAEHDGGSHDSAPKHTGDAGQNALSLLSGLGGGSGGDLLGGLDVGMLLKMKKVMDKVGHEEDDRAVLLKSLKPFLSDRRKGVYDQALKMLTLSKFASVAKDLDLF